MKYLNLRLVRFSTRQPPAKSFILILSITFLVVFVSVDSNAVQIQTYTVADGLVGPVVPIIFQDSRGVLWLGSDRGGVTRFHDNIFEPYVGNQYAEDVAAGALLGRTLQIVEDKWGHIWFLTWVPGEKLGRISRFDGASVSFITTGNSLATDQHGDIWVSDNHLLTRYVSSGFQKLPQAEPNEIVGEGLIRSTAGAVNVSFESREGTFWLGGSEGVGEE